MTETITRIAMGADVPPWLIVTEPATPSAWLKSFRFSTDVLVIDTPEFYVVIGVGPPGAGMMHLEGGDQNVFAADKMVRAVCIDTSFFPRGMVPLQPVPQPTNTTPIAHRTRPTLWQRIKRVWA